MSRRGVRASVERRRTVRRSRPVVAVVALGLVLAAVDALVGAGIVDAGQRGQPAVAVGGERPASVTTLGPEVAVEPSRAEIGERVTLTIEGFEAQSVTVSLCGNGARRGSADCDMVSSTGLRLDDGGAATVAVVTVGEPPMPCPCVMRVSSLKNDEIAVVPIDVIGHPVAEPVGAAATSASLDVSISATRLVSGLGDRLLSSLGGSTSYEVVISVTNLSPTELAGPEVLASFGRDELDVVQQIVVPAPTSIAAGRTWQYVSVVDVPGREFGGLVWKVEASKDAAPVVASSTTSHRPTLLMLLVLLMVVLAGYRLIMWRIRHHASRPAPAEPSASQVSPTPT